MTKIEIIDETVEYYSNNPRAIQGNLCLYLTEDNLRCAHSRCIKDDKVEEVHECANTGGSAKKIIDEFTDDVHKEEYQGYSVDFWLDIQHLHDYHAYWNGNQLNKEGIEHVEYIKIKYKI